MCGGGSLFSGIIDAAKGLTGLGTTRAEKAERRAKASLQAEQDRLLAEEETKRKQRKATATILTSGQGLGVGATAQGDTSLGG